MKVGVAYVDLCISRHLKEKAGLGKWLHVISNICYLNSYATKKLQNKAVSS